MLSSPCGITFFFAFISEKDFHKASKKLHLFNLFVPSIISVSKNVLFCYLLYRVFLNVQACEQAFEKNKSLKPSKVSHELH